MLYCSSFAGTGSGATTGDSTAEATCARERRKNLARLALLAEQRSDLVSCLDSLWGQIHSGHRRFKLYRQMKMYNDPTLNPVLYRTRLAP